MEQILFLNRRVCAKDSLLKLIDQYVIGFQKSKLLYSIREKILYSSFFLSYYNAGGVLFCKA